MRRQLSFALFVIAVALPTSAAKAQQQIIDFEGLNSQAVFAGYAGLVWSSGFNEWALYGSGPFVRPSSGQSNAASDEGSTITFARPGELFNLNSMFLSEYLGTGGDPKEINASILGFRDGQIVYSTDITYDRNTMTQVDFGWTNVDKVMLTGIRGRILVDDISITATPEPATVGLLGTGMLGLFVARRRKPRGTETA
ncbi:MAG: PEP-CTERM sorting domain-containing protein [bacterium]